MELISVDELIKKLKESNIDFGKGDPYNRLRYYTKIGLIPHMVRKKNDKNTNSGHFPASTYEKILQIERHKEEGLSNEEILKKFNSEEGSFKNQNLFQKIKYNLTINKIFILLIFIGLILETYRFSNSNFFKTNYILENNAIPQNLNTVSGVTFIPNGQKKVFIPTNKVNDNSNILLGLRGSIFPASNIFVSEVKENIGFYVETNIEVSKEVKFTWTIIN